MTEPEAGARNEAARRGLQIPPFSEDEPEFWFVQLEVQFAIHNITADKIKFQHALTGLSARAMKEISDILKNPPPTGRYKKLKLELIRRLSKSEEEKIRQLLAREELGNRKPSEFLEHLIRLAGTAVPQTLIRTIWTNRLPRNLQTILDGQTEIALEEVVKLADKIHKATTDTTNNISAPSPPSPPPEMAEPRQEVNESDQEPRLVEDQERSRNRNHAHRRSISRDRSAIRLPMNSAIDDWYRHAYSDEAIPWRSAWPREQYNYIDRDRRRRFPDYARASSSFDRGSLGHRCDRHNRKSK